MNKLSTIFERKGKTALSQAEASAYSLGLTNTEKVN
jgi:hypothetical protein